MTIIDTDENYLGCGQLTTAILEFDDECMGRGQLTTIIVLAGKLSY